MSALAPVLCAVFVVMALAVPVFTYEVTEQWDHGWHQTYARYWFELGRVSELLPHVGYHLLLMGVLRAAPGVDMRVVGLGVMLVTYAACGLAVYACVAAVAGERRWLAALLTVTLMYAAPVNFLNLGQQNLYFGYIAPNVYHNPTTILLKPLALAQFWLTLRALGERNTPSWVLPSLIGLSLAGILVKPNWALCLLPAAGLITVIRKSRRQPVDVSTLTFGLFVPSVCALAAQYLFFEATRGGIVFAPLWSLSFHDTSIESLTVKLLLSLALPLVVAAVDVRAVRRLPEMALAWVGLVIGLAQFYLLNETKHYWAGNFWWGAQVGLFILFVVSVRRMLAWLDGGSIDERLRAIPRLVAAGGVLLLHVAGGMLWWYVHAAQPIVGRVLRVWW